MSKAAATDPFIPADIESGEAVPFGIDSEYGALEHVLLCPPTHMRWEPEANAVSRAVAQMGYRFDRDRAMDQHAALAGALKEAGVTCHFLDPDPLQASQTFTRDSSFMTPWGAVITLMDATVRRGEYARVLQYYLTHKIPVWNFVTAGSVEGGDVHVVCPGKALIGYSNGRTDEEGARQVAGWFRDAGWEVRLQHFPEHFLHIDVLFCMLAEGVAVICTDVLGKAFVDDVKADYGIHTVVPVTYNEAMALGANGVALGDGRVLMAKQASGSEISEKLRAEGLSVTELDLSMFVLDGGGPHCLTMPLKRKTVG